MKHLQTDNGIAEDCRLTLNQIEKHLRILATFGENVEYSAAQAFYFNIINLCQFRNRLCVANISP